LLEHRGCHGKVAGDMAVTIRATILTIIETSY
jgi:hypothetical protein